ncbi:putative transmembrane protein [Heterostelium album PN500]|uniref:Putative transmembrane protein n=1 Tax=Heterostelium pallidum (strain ATCC 26659 / Pp 5 / PN500) TaxID=670386 RepID=D3AZP7_HETP5|nr:putative transmembrane protein [Heterostelium album PN500]EFA85426.1 putative transmembrane protein [Heterostelium album PN500]|eukprot:XP_020437535.1 putative transmembrane protein [Heterostelium album PN500]
MSSINNNNNNSNNLSNSIGGISSIGSTNSNIDDIILSVQPATPPSNNTTTINNTTITTSTSASADNSNENSNGNNSLTSSQQNLINNNSNNNSNNSNNNVISSLKPNSSHPNLMNHHSHNQHGGHQHHHHHNHHQHHQHTNNHHTVHNYNSMTSPSSSILSRSQSQNNINLSQNRSVGSNGSNNNNNNNSSSNNNSHLFYNVQTSMNNNNNNTNQSTSMSNSFHKHSLSLGVSYNIHGSTPGFIRDDISVSFQDTYNDNQRIHLHPDIGLTSREASEEGEKIPVMLACVEPLFNGIVLRRGDTYSSELLTTRLLEVNPDFGEKEKQHAKEMAETLFTSGRCCFVVHETPSFPQLTAATLPSTRPINPVINAINYIHLVMERFLWITISISLVSNIIRSILQKQRSLVDLLIIRQVDLAIAFSLIMLPSVLLILVYSIGHAKLLALFDVLQERSLKGEIADDHPALNFDTEYDEDRLPKVPFDLVVTYWRAIMSTKHVAFSHSSNLLHHIASTTTICCLDKDGIVSEPVNTVGEISFLKQDGPVRLELSSEYSHTQYSITFNDHDWQEHINALKPLGLDCLLNKTCRLYTATTDTSRPNSTTTSNLSDHVSKLHLIRDREDSSDTTNSQCLCLLAKEIGFSDEVANQFASVKEIHTLTQRSNNKEQPDDDDNESPSMISLVAKDIGSETLQLLSKGSTELVLDHCTHYWDGENIVVFDDEEKEKVRAVYTKWLANDGMKGISFAYKPIEQKFKKLFDGGSVNSPLVDVRFSNSTIVRRKKDNLRMQLTKKAEYENTQPKTANIFISSPIPFAQPKTPITRIEDIQLTLSGNHPFPFQGGVSTSSSVDDSSPTKKDNKDNSNNNNNNSEPVVILVESPIPSGKQSPAPVKSKKTKFLKPYKSKKSKKKAKQLEKENKMREQQLQQDKISGSPESELSMSATITKQIILPPIELDYEATDDTHSQPTNDITNIKVIMSEEEEEELEEEEMNEDDTVVMVIDKGDNSNNNKEQSDEEEAPSEYANNDSETDSDNPYIQQQPSQTDKQQSLKQKKLKRLSREDTNSYSVSETSESDSMNDKRIRNNRLKKKQQQQQQQQLQQQQMIQQQQLQRKQQQQQQQQLSKAKSNEDSETLIQSGLSDDGTAILTTKDLANDHSFTNTVAENETLEQLQNGQIYIGMAGMKQLPKSHANHFVEVLRIAGIRFVFFSNQDSRESNSFVNKLGLETDWNCCVSLKDPAPDEVQVADGPSRLPKGINAIRRHLEEVDNVPLLVPMFSNSTPETKLEMIKILQENGEVVCCIGSALNYENTPIFCQADLAFSLEPAVSRCLNLPLNKADPRPLLTSRNFFETESVMAPLPLRKNTTTRVPSEHPSTHSLCCDITSLPCSLVFHRRTDFNEILEFFHVGRQLLTNTRQSLQFILSASMTLVLMCLVAGVLVVSYPVDGVVGGIPLTGLQLIWLQFLIIPLVGLSLLFTTEDEDVMRTLSPKNNSEFKHIPIFARYIGIRLVPSLILMVSIFIWCLQSLSGASWSNIFGANMSEWEPSSEKLSYSDALIISQNIMMFAFVFYLGVTSLSFIHHTRSVLKFNPFRKNYKAVITVIFCIILQICFTLVTLKIIGGVHLLSEIPKEIYAVLFGWAPFVILLDEIVKHLYKKWFADLQLELRLEFDTKLGMHSPI